MRLLYTQLILLNALCMMPSLTAEETLERPNGKITIAVMHIQANNCSETLAMAVKDILSHKLFEAGTFILLERSHVDTLLQKHPESITGRTDPQGMAEIGKILSVQKVVTGSVTSLGKFRIDLRFIDSEKGTIDLSLPTGDMIPVEERSSREITHFQGIPLAPKGVKAANPAFDITPHRYISAIITERGIIKGKYRRELAKIAPEKQTGR